MLLFANEKSDFQFAKNRTTTGTAFVQTRYK